MNHESYHSDNIDENQYHPEWYGETLERLMDRISAIAIDPDYEPFLQFRDVTKSPVNKRTGEAIVHEVRVYVNIYDQPYEIVNVYDDEAFLIEQRVKVGLGKNNNEMYFIDTYKGNVMHVTRDDQETPDGHTTGFSRLHRELFEEANEYHWGHLAALNYGLKTARPISEQQAREM